MTVTATPTVPPPATMPAAGGTGPKSGAGGFAVHPAALRAAAGCINAESSALGEGAVALRARLETVGRCWGDDLVGRRFAATYEPAAQIVLGNLDALADGLAHIAAALAAVATSYERVDHGVATDARALLARIGSPPVARKPATP